MENKATAGDLPVIVVSEYPSIGQPWIGLHSPTATPEPTLRDIYAMLGGIRRDLAELVERSRRPSGWVRLKARLKAWFRSKFNYGISRYQ